MGRVTNENNMNSRCNNKGNKWKGCYGGLDE